MDCSNSILWQKLHTKELLETMVDGMGIPLQLCGSTMPQGTDESAPQIQRDTICQWIMMGAPPN